MAPCNMATWNPNGTSEKNVVGGEGKRSGPITMLWKRHFGGYGRWEGLNLSTTGRMFFSMPLTKFAHWALAPVSCDK